MTEYQSVGWMQNQLLSFAFALGFIGVCLCFACWIAALSFAVFLLNSTHFDQESFIMKRFWDLVDRVFSIPIYSAGPSTMLPSLSNSNLVSLLIPGLTLSPTGSLYWISTLFFSAILHESSHALVAYIQGVEINSVGIALFCGILPMGVYVELDERDLNEKASRSRWTLISIASAGPLCNFAISFVAQRILKAFPFLLTFFFLMGRSGEGDGRNGRLVVLSDESRISFGLPLGSVITSINSHILGTEYYYEGVVEEYSRVMLHSLPPTQFCQPIRLIEKRESCCSSSALTKEYKDKIECIWDTASLSIYKSMVGVVGNIVPTHCGLLKPSFYNTSVSPFLSCVDNQDCGDAEASVCMAPCSFHTEKRLLILQTTGSVLEDASYKDGESSSVALITSPAYFYSSVLVGEIPESFIPHLLKSTSIFLRLTLLFTPLICEMWLRYLYSINIGLGLLNIVPAFAFDGSHILDAVFHDNLGLNWMQRIFKIPVEALLMYMAMKVSGNFLIRFASTQSF